MKEILLLKDGEIVLKDLTAVHLKMSSKRTSNTH